MAADSASPRPRAFLDVSVGRSPAARLEVRLFWAHAPRTCANFAALCSGSHGSIPGDRSGRPLCFRGSRLHRIIPGFMAQGGDITAGDGTGGASIYNGGGDFADENLGMVHGGGGGGRSRRSAAAAAAAAPHGHSRRGLLSMANAGPDTNRSQFFILFGAAPHLDGRHVIFGEVDLSNAAAVDVLRKIEECGSRSGKPSKDVKVEDCGELPPAEGDGEQEEEEEEEESGAADRHHVDRRGSDVAEELRAAKDAERRARAVPVAEKKMTTGKAVRMLLAKQGPAETAPSSAGAAVEAGPSNQDKGERGAAGEEAATAAAAVAAVAAAEDTAVEQEPRDPTEGMSAKQRRLFQLRLKVNQARKMNQSAVLEEKKRSKQDESAEVCLWCAALGRSVRSGHAMMMIMMMMISFLPDF